jgi:hypothetical protein
MAFVLAVVVAAGCGSQARRPEPRLSQADARELVSLAQQVARDAPIDGCAATHEIEALSAKANDLVAAGRVPARLRAPLLAGVAAVAADAPACAPPPAPAPAAAAAAPVEKHDNGKHKGKDKGKDKGKGKGHGDGQDGDEG